jgi:uncharacterized protein (TIGR01777 family)
MMRALVTGATGFVGRELLNRLDRPVVLTREPSRAPAPEGLEIHTWRNLTEERPPEEAFRDVDIVFHLAGEPVAEGRWTRAKKAAIRESRVLGTRHLVEGMANAATIPPVLVSASAVGVYGDRGDAWLDEGSEPSSGFLAEVCLGWEKEALRAASLGVRVVSLRIGIVLGPGGGALSRMLLPFRLGFGGRLGHGRQWMPWIHVDDVVGLLAFAASTESVRGPVNAVAPAPADNREFTRTLARLLGRPALLPAPAVGLQIALGEFANVLLGSQRVRPTAATAAGYEFAHPDLERALQAILSEPSPIVLPSPTSDPKPGPQQDVA